MCTKIAFIFHTDKLFNQNNGILSSSFIFSCLLLTEVPPASYILRIIPFSIDTKNIQGKHEKHTRKIRKTYEERAENIRGKMTCQLS